MENTRLSRLYPDPNKTDKSFNDRETGEKEGELDAKEKKAYHSLPLSHSWQLETPKHRVHEEQIQATSSPCSDSATHLFNQGAQKGELVEDKDADDGLEKPLTTLSPDQERVLKLVLKGCNVFFTGPAGSGKSQILEHIKYHLKKRNTTFAVTAPTGIAAVLIGGETIYSWSGVGKGDKGILEYLNKARTNSGSRRASKNKTAGWKKTDGWKKTEVLIIDEVSMVGNDFRGRG